MKTKAIIIAILSVLLISFTLCLNLNSKLDKVANEAFEKTLKDKKPFTATDLHQLKKISSTQLSPDNKYLVFQITQWNKDTKKSTTEIMYLELANSKLTETNLDGNSPTFAADVPNKIFYLDNDGKTINVTDFPVLENSKSEIVAKYPVNIDGFKIAKSGKALVFSANVYYKYGDDLDKTAANDLEVKDQGYQIYDQLMVNHWDVWNNHKVNNIFYQALNASFKAEGTQENLMKETYLEEANSPVPPFGGIEMFDISPDGSKVAFTVAKRKNEHVDTNWRIYLGSPGSKPVDITTNADETKNFEGRTQNPKFSDDGKKVYFSAMPRPWIESDYLYLAEYTIENSSVRAITKDFDYTVGDYMINNNTVIFSVDYDGATEHFAIPLTDPKQEKIVHLTNWDSFKSSKKEPFAIVKTTENNYLLYCVETSDMFPDKVSAFKYADNSWTKPPTEVLKVYEPNPEFYDNFNFGETSQEKFHFKGTFPEYDVQGWLIKPFNFDATKKYPIAFIIHGGPEGSLGNLWSYRWNPLLFASKGYAVVMVNPEGSTGLGQKFVDAVRNHWGDAPFNTLMKGLDAAIEKYTFLDGKQSCAAGASFGGYMVNWIQGHSKRFNCLVTHDGVFSTLSMFYITDEMWFPLAEYCPTEKDKTRCTPYQSEDARAGYTKFSPEQYVNEWSTPHLIIHGSNDLRIPVSEGISAFTALQMKKIPSKFLHFTEENHWVRNPENSIVWYDTVLGWFEEYIRKPNPNEEKKEVIE